MKSARHILVLAPGFPKDEADDICMPYFQDFLRIFAEKASDIRFTVIALQYPYTAGPYLWNGIDVHALGGNNRRWYKPFLWQKARQKIRAIHADRPIDAVLSLWLSETAMLGEQFARKFNLRHVAVAMGQDVLPENAYLKRLDLNRTPIVALSSHAAEVLQKSSGLKAAAIIPFAEPESSLDLLLPSQEREFDILGVGGLIPLKRFDRFLEVLAILARRHPGLRVALIGEGGERPKLEAMAKDLGILTNTRFLGQQTRKSTLEWMQRTKVLLHTSTQEGQGYVFTEALNRGMYVVSTACGMAQESEDWAVRDGVEELAQAVEAFWNKASADAVQRKSRNEAAQRRMVEEYLALLCAGDAPI